MNIGGVIQRLRKRRKIRQMDMFAQIGIQQSYLSKIENNHRHPSLDTLRAICDILTIPVPILFFLAIEDEDIPPEKKAIYAFIKPAIRHLEKHV